MQIDLHKSRDSFALIGDAKDEYKFKFIQAKLYVRQVKISADVLLAHAKILQTSTVKYPIKKVETKAIVISSGVTNATLEGVSKGPLPNRIVFGLVDCDSYNGSYAKNCFNFKHNNLIEVGVVANGSHVPYSPISLDFDKSLLTASSYASIKNFEL